MRKIIQDYQQASLEIKLFIWTIFMIALILIFTTGFAYLRLDSSRSSKIEKKLTL